MGRTFLSATIFAPMFGTRHVLQVIPQFLFTTHNGDTSTRTLHCLIHQTIVPVAAPGEPVQSPPRPVLLHPEAAFFGGDDAKEVMAQLESQGLSETTALATLTALGAALGLVGSGSLVATTGLRVLATGLVTGTITMQIATAGAGAVVTLTGVGMIALGITLGIIALHYVAAPPNEASIHVHTHIHTTPPKRARRWRRR